MPSDLMDRYSLLRIVDLCCSPLSGQNPANGPFLPKPSVANPRVRAWHADALFEHARIASFRHEDDRRRFVTSHALVRLVLSQATGLPATKLRFAARCHRCGGAHGKPRVEAAPQLHISISHAADRVAVAVTALGPV